MAGFADFIRKVSNDPDLAAEMIRLGRTGEQGFVSGVMTLGATHGYSFSEAEVRKMFAALKEDNMLADQLTDNELELVAGGGVRARTGGGGGQRSRAAAGAKSGAAGILMALCQYFYDQLSSL